MFDNIGEKLRGLASVTAIIGIVFSVIAGLGMMLESFLLGVIYMLIGALLSWVGSWTVYGIGEAVTNSERCLYKIHQLERELDQLKGSDASNFATSYARPAHAQNPAGQAVDLNRVPAWKRVAQEKEQQ